MNQQAANSQQANQVQTEHGSAATDADPQQQQQQHNNINGNNINGHIGVPPPDAAMGFGMHGDVAVPMSPLGVMATSIATPLAPTTLSRSRPGTRSSSRYSLSPYHPHCAFCSQEMTNALLDSFVQKRAMNLEHRTPSSC